MPRNAEHSPNTFIASPTDCSACVSSCTPDAEWFAFFSFIFEDGGVAIFELRVHVQTGVRRALQRGPALSVKQDDILELLEWRKKRLMPDGVKFLQVTPIVAKQLVDSAIESCGQTLLDKQPWGQSWNALNACIMLLQFRHADYAAQISTMDYRLGTSSTECFLREPAITQKMNPALRSTTQNGYKSDAEAGLGVVPLVGGAGTPTASVRTCLYTYLNLTHSQGLCAIVGVPARAKLRGTVVPFRNYNMRDVDAMMPPPSCASFSRTTTVSRQGHADATLHQLARAKTPGLLVFSPRLLSSSSLLSPRLHALSPCTHSSSTCTLAAYAYICPHTTLYVHLSSYCHLLDSHPHEDD
jgi:hypothetical protein